MDKKYVNLLQGSITLAQTFAENINLNNYDKNIEMGENIIRYIYKWFGGKYKYSVEDAIREFRQHNTDCRYECYCCGQCHDIEDFKMDEPNIKDEYVKNIKDLLLTFTEYKGENEDINKIFSN